MKRKSHQISKMVIVLCIVVALLSTTTAYIQRTNLIKFKQKYNQDLARCTQALHFQEENDLLKGRRFPIVELTPATGKTEVLKSSKFSCPYTLVIAANVNGCSSCLNEALTAINQLYTKNSEKLKDRVLFISQGENRLMNLQIIKVTGAKFPFFQDNDSNVFQELSIYKETNLFLVDSNNRILEYFAVKPSVTSRIGDFLVNICKYFDI